MIVKGKSLTTITVGTIRHLGIPGHKVTVTNNNKSTCLWLTFQIIFKVQHHCY